jgi:acyl-CoA dehydrogenase
LDREETETIVASAIMNARPATTHTASAARAAARTLRVAGDTSGSRENLAARAERVAAVAAQHAAAVDHESRVPAEAIAAARAEQLFGAAIPREFGGEGASIGEIVDICYTLGRVCASSAMIFAMHQTKVACVVRHASGSPWHQRLMRQIAAEELPLASSTTEGNRGGDLRHSAAPIEAHNDRITLERMATVISYAEAADAIVTTARRSPDAASGDQVLAVFLKNDYQLERQVGWDALGMRGTECRLPTRRVRWQRSDPAGKLRRDSRAHDDAGGASFWSAAWAGIAAAAVDRARAFVRKAAHRAADATMPPSAGHLTRAATSMRTLRSVIANAVRRFDLAAADPVALESIDFQTGMNLHKVQASELAVATVMSAMQACGLSGYRNDGDFSIGRHLRDILSAPIMISNDRIIANVGTASLLGGAPASLLGGAPASLRE